MKLERIKKKWKFELILVMHEINWGWRLYLIFNRVVNRNQISRCESIETFALKVHASNYINERNWMIIVSECVLECVFDEIEKTGKKIIKIMWLIKGK